MGASESAAMYSAWLTPALMVYYLCCWPGDSESDSNSDHSTARRGVVRHDSGSHRRASEFFSRRIGSSVVSLHLPSTSGEKSASVNAHHSHEELCRRVSGEASARYHSAPSVIHEVLHRRDWDTSRDLYIPLKPEDEIISVSTTSPDAPRAEPETSSIEDHKTDDRSAVSKVCKKHHTNIKSSARKETRADEDKDRDATEDCGFYIGDNDVDHLNSSPRKEEVHAMNKCVFRAKEAKQSFNESLRWKDRPRQLPQETPSVLGHMLDDVIARLDSLDRSGATHHTIESRISLSKPPIPPPSVEAVGYDGGACYLAEAGRVCELRAVREGTEHGGPAARGPTLVCQGTLRSRHASDGDILAPHLRPESGAFSESEIELALEGPETEPVRSPPPRQAYVRHGDRRETAI